ncbi:uncharacterized protein LOC106869459 [Xyrichtys novacula]|uniref:Uncharacterized protein LOC106869459 n=1 Tax=Xyrichtys novacula TaxID=13765 RepID=A0AAV1FEC5_XYRNO|nr:uncharacterized protein LOC106869459 [Xyrichtys novacula]
MSQEKTRTRTVEEHQHLPPLTIGEQTKRRWRTSLQKQHLKHWRKTRTGKAAGVFQRLLNIWLLKSITTATKLRLYMSVDIPTATYACETWTKTGSITNKFDVLHRRGLRSILKISWRDHITDEEVMKRTGEAPSSDIVSDRRERKTGHEL